PRRQMSGPQNSWKGDCLRQWDNFRLLIHSIPADAGRVPPLGRLCPLPARPRRNAHFPASYQLHQMVPLSEAVSVKRVDARSFQRLYSAICLFCRLFTGLHGLFLASSTVSHIVTCRKTETRLAAPSLCMSV